MSDEVGNSLNFIETNGMFHRVFMPLYGVVQGFKGFKSRFGCCYIDDRVNSAVGHKYRGVLIAVTAAG